MVSSIGYALGAGSGIDTASLIEGLVDGEITAEHTILGPSTGNFGIGTAYISNLLGLKAVVILERWSRLAAVPPATREKAAAEFAGTRWEAVLRGPTPEK